MSKPLSIQYTGKYANHLLREKDKEIERLNKKIEQYENPEDMTLMFMWCDEKAKDEIKRLNNIIKEVREYIEKVETLAMVDKVNIFSMSTLKTILDKEKDNE